MKSNTNIEKDTESSTVLIWEGMIIWLPGVIITHN